MLPTSLVFHILRERRTVMVGELALVPPVVAVVDVMDAARHPSFLEVLSRRYQVSRSHYYLILLVVIVNHGDTESHRMPKANI